MAGGILTEAQIMEVSEAIKKRRLNVSRVELAFTEGYIKVDPIGIEGIPQTEEYYENIEDHLVYSDLSWFGPICKKYKLNWNATIDVNPEGEFEHESIPAVLHTTFNGTVSTPRILKQLMPVIEKLVPIRDEITEVEIGWHNGYVHTIRFFMNMNGKKINKTLNTPGTNFQIKNQWASAITQIINMNKVKYKHTVKLPVVGGRINTTNTTIALSFKFKPEGI